MAGLFKRVSNAVSSSIHELLDSGERPDAIARQLVRETTRKVARIRTLAIEAVASEKQLAKDIAAQTSLVDSSQLSASRAMIDGNEAAARAALAQKIGAKNLLDQLIPQQRTAAANSAALKERLVELEQSLAQLRSREKALAARQKGALAIEQAETLSHQLQHDSDIESRLQRAEDLVVEMETRNEAIADIAAATNAAQQADAQRQSGQLEAELEALRRSS